MGYLKTCATEGLPKDCDINISRLFCSNPKFF